VAKKLRKFDVSNDGELSPEELIAAVITLQKQSDSYKKMVWYLIPLIAILVVSIFGVTVLAIKVTKEITVSQGAMLTTVDGAIVQTAPAYQSKLQFDHVSSNSTDSTNATKNAIKVFQHQLLSDKKVEVEGKCIISNRNAFYLAFSNGYYAKIQDVILIDVLYYLNQNPYANYDYTIGQRLWFRDSGNYFVRFQIKSLSCPVSFVYICATSELQFRLDGPCEDPNVLKQYELYVGSPFNEDNVDEEYFTGGRTVKPATSPITKTVGVKASSYVNCVLHCKSTM